MTKKINILATFILFCTLTNGQTIKSVEVKLFGEEEPIAVTSKKAVKKALNEQIKHPEFNYLFLNIHRRFKYDKNGNLISEINLKNNKEIIVRNLTYNQFSKIIKEETIYPESRKNGTTEINYEYNQFNELTKIIEKSEKQTIIITHNIIDSNTIESEKSINGRLNSRFKTLKDFEKNSERKYLFNSDDSLELIEELIFGSNNQIIKKMEYDLNKPYRISIFEYDSLNNRVYEKTENILDNTITEIFESNNTECNCIEYKRFVNNSLVFWLKQQYDSKKNPITIERLRPDSSLHSKRTFEYEFDKYGNWIVSKEFENEKLLEIIYKTIEYLDE
jgi:hypothetical protein